MQNLTTDIDSVGGGFGGFGSGNNPLLWLITLGFLKGDGGILGGGNNGGAGVLAGETQAKLDCLAQQHQTLSNQISKNDTDQNFTTLGLSLDSLANIQRDATSAITNQVNDVRQQIADCCCDLKSGQQSIKTDIAMQTSTLVAEGLKNTQAVLDRLCASDLAAKDAEIRRLQDDLQTQTILANCGGNGHGHGRAA